MNYPLLLKVYPLSCSGAFSHVPWSPQQMMLQLSNHSSEFHTCVGFKVVFDSSVMHTSMTTESNSSGDDDPVMPLKAPKKLLADRFDR